MKTFLELFARQSTLLLALLLVVGTTVTLKLDARIGMLLVGIVFGLNGVGHFLTAEKQTSGRGLQKGIGVFLILFGLFTIVVMLVMFARGETLSSASP